MNPSLKAAMCVCVFSGNPQEEERLSDPLLEFLHYSTMRQELGYSTDLLSEILALGSLEVLRVFAGRNWNECWVLSRIFNFTNVSDMISRFKFFESPLK